MDIAAWLKELGLERYEDAFREHAIDAAILPKLTADDLRDIGVAAVGHRRKLLEAIAALSALDEPAPRGEARPIAAERRQLTVLFVDLVGSTALSARLDPEDMGALIRAYHGACAKTVERWGGHVAKYMGDGVLAYFGWPQAHEDDAERAVRAGLELVAAVSALDAPGLALRGGRTERQPLAARVGIATGLVMVGELIGEGAAKEQTVVGETPNLAARLQALAAPGSVVISQATRRLVGGLFELADLGPRRLKGFAEPLAAFRVQGESHAEGRFEALRGHRVTPLVGRAHELAMLMERWAWAKDGGGQVVLLSGEPGIGKSRLLRALRQELSGEPHIALSHFCSPHHVNSALHPVIAQLERAAGFTPQDDSEAKLAKLEALFGQATDQLDETVPLLAALMGIPMGDDYPALNLSPQRQKQRTLEVLLEQLAGLARERPVLELYEDVHWIDPSTLELLDLLVERVRALPLLVVVTHRPEFTPPWTGQSHVTALPLNRLGRRQGAALVARITGGKALPAEVLDQIVARTDGVPLFVEELTKTVLESGLLRDVGDRYELARPLPPLVIPSTLHDSLMARLDRLAPVREVAQTAAVIGREFSYALLTAVSPLSTTDLDTALDRLVQSELVFRRGTPPDATYSFKHALVQDVAYQSLLKSRRQRLHARIAKVLEQRFPDTASEVLARHCAQAGLTDAAIGYWRRAGEQAAGRSANAEAIAHFEQALSLLNARPDNDERAKTELDVQVALWQALRASRGFTAPEIGEALKRARELCERFGDTARLIHVLRGLWSFHQVAADWQHARDLADRMVSLVEQLDDRVALTVAHYARGGTAYFQGEFAFARAHLERGWDYYDDGQHSEHARSSGLDNGVQILNHLALTLWALGYPDQAKRTINEALGLARKLDHPFSICLALGHACLVNEHCGDWTTVERLSLEEDSLCDEYGFRVMRIHARIHGAIASVGRGDLAKGIDELKAAVDGYRRVGQALLKPWYLARLAEALHLEGRQQEAIDQLSEAFEVVGKGERSHEAELHRVAGEVLLAMAGREANAEARLLEALNVARRQEAKSWELRAATSLAHLRRARGKRAEALDLLAPVCTWFTEGFDTRDLRNAKALLDQLR